MTSLKSIRSHFLSYFEGRATAPHEVVPSAPLVPQNDPTLLFVNSGMVPFKNVFTGLETRPYKRAVSSQKCVRAGGKHNDLDNVGYTARHHTFFEMLGNFSFGDYFKAEAIEAAWTLVVDEFGLDADRLLVTVYHTDDDAFTLWRKIAGLDERRIIRIDTKDNFWSMGDVGPCGPCSEIFFDHGPDIPGGPPGSPDEDGDRFIEIWNLVFMQYETLDDGRQVDLPRPSIDTGMGLERIAAVLQGVHDNYDIDMFRVMIEKSADITGHPAAAGTSDGAQVAHRVIADHLRSACFLIADGVLPANEGRGYVLRRIMRRAMRYGHSLAPDVPILEKLAPTLIEEMGEAFPELRRAQTLITQTLGQEARKFSGLLGRGLSLLEEEVAGLAPGQALPGEAAFKLYDTYGFPLDLTADAMRREGRSVDVAGFDAAMERQRAAARAAWAGSGDEADERIWKQVHLDHGATEFLGYVHTEADAQIVAILRGGTPVDHAGRGDEIEFVTNQTPFYAESGGQIGDHGLGVVAGPDGARIRITDTRKRAGVLHSHIGIVEDGELAVKDTIRLQIDDRRRGNIRANHSATHLLHAALRRILGGHVSQKGSLVTPERLRFDFSHPEPVATEALKAIEDEVNSVILQNAHAKTEIMPYDDAVDAGAIALFGEKYADDVRVLTLGVKPEDNSAPYSVELCGGTHVSQSGDIGLFVITGESAVSAGIRRIEALTGETARVYLKDRARAGEVAAEAAKTSLNELPAKITDLMRERRDLDREVTRLKKELALGGGGGARSVTDTIRTIAGTAFLGTVFHDVPAKELRAMVDEAKQQLKSGVIGFIAVNEDKVALTVGVTDDLTDQFDAVALVRTGAAAVGGKGGGGRADLAQAGGNLPDQAGAAIEAIAEALSA